MLQLGFASAIVPEMSLEEVFQLAADIGYRCVEVMCWPVSKAERRYAGVTHINVNELDATRIAAIHQLCRSTGVSISALGYYPNCLSPDSEEAQKSVEHLNAVLEGAHKLGLKNVNTFIGRDYTKSVDDNWPRLLETWKPIVKRAEQLDLRIGIENCPMLFSRDEWPGGKNIADLESDRIGLNYDPSHMVWQQMDYLAPMRNFKDRLFHIHAKDVVLDIHRLNEVGILAHPLEYHTPKLPGFGEVNWGKFFSTLTGVGYRGAVCVEVEDRAYEDSLEDRQDSLRQSYRYLRQFV
jgi:sugar phosphate isomerase/epimerase